MAMAWDERGRLWIAESKDYPNNPQPSGQGNDVIKILEDTNRDGRADKATIFADKLSIVSSLVFVNGGIIVSQAGELVALKDTNGDDKADVRESLIGGWSARDTHALASNLKYGLDNWIWGAVGYSGFNGTVGGHALNFNQALYRFSRDGRQMEHMANFTNNTWGLAFNETFDVFGSTANGEHSVYVAIPRPYYQGVKGLSANGKKKIDGHYAMQANTPKIRQVDVQGGFTAAAGHNFYTARAFPEEYLEPRRLRERTDRTRRAPRDHRAPGLRLCGEGRLEHRRERRRVVCARACRGWPRRRALAPRFLRFHHPAQPDAGRTGRAGISVPERTRQRLRLAVARACARPDLPRSCGRALQPYKPLSLSPSLPTGLTAALRHDNMFWRLTAQRLLVERGQTDVLPQLIAIVNDRTVDTIGLNSPAVHALWTMQGLGVLDGTNALALDAAKRALTHPAAGVRKAAQSVLPKTAQSVTDLLSAGALKDRDLNVRLNALLALSQMPASADAGRAIYLLSKEKEVIEDEWLPEAIWIAATRHQDGFLQAYANEVGLGEFMRIGVRGARGERPAGWTGPHPRLARPTGRPSRLRESGARRRSASTSARSGSAGRSTCPRRPLASPPRFAWVSSMTRT